MCVVYDSQTSQQERRILEETVAPLTPRSSALPSPSRGERSSASEAQDAVVCSVADWERKQQLLERQSVNLIDSLKLMHAFILPPLSRGDYRGGA